MQDATVWIRAAAGPADYDQQTKGCAELGELLVAAMLIVRCPVNVLGYNVWDRASELSYAGSWECGKE